VRNAGNGSSINTMEPLLSVEEAAMVLGISKWTLYIWCETGKCKSIKLGRLRKIRPEDLRALVEGGTR
jgi:excisionase family DNA binding protein